MWTCAKQKTAQERWRWRGLIQIPTSTRPANCFFVAFSVASSTVEYAPSPSVLVKMKSNGVIFFVAAAVPVFPPSLEPARSSADVAVAGSDSERVGEVAEMGSVLLETSTTLGVDGGDVADPDASV